MSLFRSLWADDAVWRIGPPNTADARGSNAIVNLLTGLLAQWEFFAQMPHGGVVKVDGDRATSRYVVQEFARARGEPKFYNNLAVYEDELVRDPAAADGWRYARRTYHYLWLDASTPIAGRAFPLPPELGRSGETTGGTA